MCSGCVCTPELGSICGFLSLSLSVYLSLFPSLVLSLAACVFAHLFVCVHVRVHVCGEGQEMLESNELDFCPPFETGCSPGMEGYVYQMGGSGLGFYRDVGIKQAALPENTPANAQTGSQPPPELPDRPTSPGTTLPPDYHVPILLWLVADFKAGTAITRRGGVGKECFCIRCDDVLDDRKDMFCMSLVEDGDTIESMAHACNAFPEDLYMINIADHKECKERSQQGLKENTGGVGNEELPDPYKFFDKIGFKTEAGAPGAPDEHTGPNTNCKCSICVLDEGMAVRLFRQCSSLEGLIPTALFPISVRQIVIDALHCIMRITESLLWSLICCVSSPPPTPPPLRPAEPSQECLSLSLSLYLSIYLSISLAILIFVNGGHRLMRTATWRS